MQDLHTSEESRYMPHLRQTVLNTSRREGAACSGSPLIRLRRTSPRERWWRQPPKGETAGMVQEEFDSKSSYHFPSFSLEVVKSLQRLPSFPLLFIHFLSHFSRKS